MATYATTPSGEIALMLTKAEARGLRRRDDEGAAGLLTNRLSAGDYLDGPVAVDGARGALDTLAQASAN